jgi:Protein of unknown function (DUF3768)
MKDRKRFGSDSGSESHTPSSAGPSGDPADITKAKAAISPNPDGLNDGLRRYLYDGGVIMTPGIAALGEQAIGQIANAIATFDDFCNLTDPSGVYHRGTLDFEGKSVVFKIQRYPLDFDSVDTGDITSSHRIIIIKLAGEVD